MCELGQEEEGAVENIEGEDLSGERFGILKQNETRTANKTDKIQKL